MKTTAALLPAAFAALVAGVALAQADKPFAPGDIFIDQNGATVQVLACRGAGATAECNLRLIAGNAYVSPTTWYMLSTLRESERNWLRNGNAPYAGPRLPLPTAAAAPAVRPATAAAAPAAAAKPVQAAQAAQGGACPRSPYGGPVTGATPASEALFRRKVTDSYTMAAYGPYWYGVTFETFSVGAPIRNTVSVGAGGATRVTNGAPPNALLYPVDSTQTICEGAPTSAERRRTETKRYCFVSANNEWTCAAR